MILLPIVARELRVASRSRGYYWLRFLAGLISVGFAIYIAAIVIGYGAVDSNSSGQVVFAFLAWVGLFICIGSARNTTDCISEEKREGTIGLLFLTDLKGYDVIMGKLFACSVRSFYGLLATVPVVSCALVMGGLTLTTVVRTVLALLNVFFFVQALGIMVSTFSRNRHRAGSATLLLLMLFFIAIPAGTDALRNYGFYSQAGSLELFGPASAFNQAQPGLFVAPLRGTPMHSTYWQSLAIVHSLAWLFLGLASLVVPRSWQDKPVKGNTRWSDRLRQWCFGPPDVREALRLKLIGINPFLWLISRDRLGQIAVWAVLGLIGCGWFWIWLLLDIKPSDSMGFFVMIILLNHTLLKYWVAAEAGGHLAEQRRSGALEYLLSCTPLAVEDIITGQWLALRRRFLRPLVLVLAVDIVLIAVSSLPVADNNRDSLATFTGCVLAGMFMLVADLATLGWVAMWQAMVEKKPRTAAGNAIIRILVLPWVIMGFMAPLGFFRFTELVVVFWWFILGVGIDLAFGAYSRDRLMAEFRDRAATRPEEKLGLFGQMGRVMGKLYPR